MLKLEHQDGPKVDSHIQWPDSHAINRACRFNATDTGYPSHLHLYSKHSNFNSSILNGDPMFFTLFVKIGPRGEFNDGAHTYQAFVK